MPSRANEGAVEEFRIITTNLSDPHHFVSFLKTCQPQDKKLTVYKHLGQEVYFGKKLFNAFVEALQYTNNYTDSKFSFKVPPEKIIHLESAKAEIEEMCNLKEGYLYKCKADLMVKYPSEPYTFYSIKLDEGIPKKLGQLSEKTTFGSASLGGLATLFDETFFNTPSPEKISWGDTELSLSSYNKLKQRKNALHLRLAYFKKNSLSWKHILKLSCLEAESVLKNFQKDIEMNKESLIEFIIYLLRGPNPEIENNYYILTGGKFYPLKELHHFLKEADYKYYCHWYGNSSLVISINYKGRKYNLTKIQFSFEGGKPEVSQTKGIIFHAQEYKVKNEYSLWDLIEDISKNFSN
jgi:RNAse (barnase) inhibitor barstar